MSSQMSDTRQLTNASGVRRSTLIVGVLLSLVVGYIFGMRHDTTLLQLGQETTNGKVNFSSAQEVYDELIDNYDGDISPSDVIDGANRGVAAAANDPYTQYFDAEEAKAFDEALHGEVSGIGVVISIRNEVPTIVRVIDNGPAKAAGLKPFDVIAEVADENVLDMTVDSVAQRIRGEAGTSVKLTIVRAGDEKEISVERAAVKDPSVASEITDGIGIITVRRFEEETTGLVRKAAQEMKDANVRGVILDLRDNTGGTVTAAQGVAGVWLDHQVIMIQKAKNTDDVTVDSTGMPILGDTKTVILSNGASASASEIVIGALRDHGKATIIGETTYGKGSMQRVLDLSRGGVLKVTIARWYTPNDTAVDGEGIAPDKMVKLTPEDLDKNRDPQRAAALAELK